MEYKMRPQCAVCTINLAIIISIPTAASAAGCGFGDINADNAKVAVVQPDRLHFIKDNSAGKGCPNDSLACQEKAYVVAKDFVLTAGAQGAYVCAGYVTNGGSALSEWLAAGALRPVSPDQESPTDWVGKWSMYDNDISIVTHGEALRVRGDAEWKDGANVHAGTFDNIARPQDGKLSFTSVNGKTLPFNAGDEFDCRVSMVRRGPYLLVKDNGACGGANVSFTGFYKRGVRAKR